ncbi:FUSC family protein [Streptomyces olivoreticuli]|uniref:FUSC family protein n=1 Tax=Streptomyces olivoreticuli TaxID=68246 RepID=UPI00265A8DED|nr:FUSC family protein [Streptomyces olivoreticuli]WKK24745.1 FUSC family protein [Streptomyces olivoreticuli]
MPEQTTRRLPLRGTLRLNRAGDIWHKPAFSAVAAIAVPDGVLLATDRLDLALYTSAGALCALYGHARPYAARGRALAGVVLGMAAGVGIALTAASLTGSVALLVVVAALLAAVQKTLCDAFRTGPPGSIVLTFVSSTACFVPQRPGEVPFHVGLVLACGAFAWLICMAPRLVRPYGPERIATARALEAAARLLRADTDAAPRARHTATALTNAAHAELRRAPSRRRDGAGVLAALELLLVRAESATADRPGSASEAELYDAWARDLRKGRALPGETTGGGEAPGGRPPGGPTALDRLRPGSPLLLLGARVLAGCVLAGWASAAVGIGHPYWAVVTAASVFQANSALSWQRAVQRVLGNLLGLLLFTALLPVARTGPLAMVALSVALQFGAEALITRNYWLATVCVTPMSLLLGEFAGSHPARPLVGDRWADTLVGAAVALLACALVTDRRRADRVDAAVDRVAEARATALALLDAPHSAHEAGRARDRLATVLVELRETADAAAGEWRRRALPQGHVERAERDGHHALAVLARRLATAAA